MSWWRLFGQFSLTKKKKKKKTIGKETVLFGVETEGKRKNQEEKRR